MSYWGSGPEENDFAFGSVGVAILRIKKKLFEDIALVAEKTYPEQSIVAQIACLRILGERFPKNLAVHFRRRDLERAKLAFNEWFANSEAQIPKKYREDLFRKAEIEFQLFEERILGVESSPK